MQPELLKRKSGDEPETQTPYKFRDARARANGYMYNMTQYCRDNVEKYLKAVNRPASALKRVATPFIDESRIPSDITVAVDSPDKLETRHSGATRSGADSVGAVGAAVGRSGETWSGPHGASQGGSQTALPTEQGGSSQTTLLSQGGSTEHSVAFRGQPRSGRPGPR